jgi:predicted nucleic-acid-binding Zn-ribbon protein
LVEEKKVVKCPKCQQRMVKQADLAVLPKLERDHVGSVSFHVSDDIPMRVFVCPNCHYIEFYYERT